MAMAPKGHKKKYDYFDGGRGISDIGHEGGEVYNGVGDHSDSSSSPRIQSYSSSPSLTPGPLYNAFQEPSSPLDFSTTSRMLSPIAYTSQAFPTLPYQDFTCAPILTSAFNDLGERSALADLRERYIQGELPSRQPWSVGESSSDGFGSDMPPTYLIDDDEDEARRQQMRMNTKNKRAQKCRMCANHGQIVDMKGHKWYCPFRDCKCHECDITRKTQYYMKERQKLTRHQQQSIDDRGQECQGSSEPSRRRSNADSQMDFPRVDEMVNQTENILDYDLFNKVNLACRPKSSHPFQ